MEGVATSDSLSRARDYVDRSRSKTDTSGLKCVYAPTDVTVATEPQ
jgi:hypothetical protein